MSKTNFGKPIWHDLTVDDPERLRPFYEAVCNWQTSEHDMGDYADFDVSTQEGGRVAGLCHARDSNAALPPVWLMYVAVPSLKDALAQVKAHGGEVVDERHGSFAVIRDPAGAHLALLEQAA
ncbi:MAG: VOC family protein [Pseudomonadota bacterium]